MAGRYNPPAMSNAETLHIPSGSPWYERRGASVALVALLALLASASSLGNGFAYDDITLVVDNDRLAHWNDPQRIWLTDWWYNPPDVTEERHRDLLYRPLTMQTLALNYAIGGEHPFGYHAFNVLVHVLASMLAYAVTVSLFASPLTALLSGGLFAVHPIHTEAVANVVGRAEVLSALFVFLGMVCLHRDVTATGRAARIGWRVGTWLSFLAGMLSKEQAVCFLGLAPLCEWWWRRRGAARAAWWTSIVLRHLPLVAPLGVYLWMRWMALGGKLLRGVAASAFDNPLTQATLWERIFTPPVVLAKYLLLMVWPADLSSDYSFGAIPLADAPWEPMAALGLAIVGGAAVWAARSLRGDGAGFFIVACFFVSYALISNTVLLIGTIMGERLFYLPSLFVCWAMVYGAGVGVRRLSAWVGGAATLSKQLPWVAGALFLVMTVRSAVRNLDWQSGDVLFTHDLRVQPNSARLNLFAGKSDLIDGEIALAEEHVRRSIDIYPYAAEAHRVLGWIRATAGDWETAKVEYAMALQLQWEYKAAQREYEKWRQFFESGSATADVEERLAAVEAALTTQPADAALLRERAALRTRAGEYRQAIEAWRAVLERDPDDLEARFELATVLSIDEQYEAARREFETIVQRSPDDWRPHANLCMLIVGDDPEGALGHAREAVRLNPDAFEAHVNLANVLLAIGKKSEGVKQLERIRDGLPEGDPMRAMISHRIEELR